MCLMTNINNHLHKSSPSIKVYKNRCTLNKEAIDLLKLNLNDKIDISIDQEERKLGRDRIYICKTQSKKGYSLQPRGRTYRINSTQLSKSLSQYLQGYGTYRICEEVSEIENGVIYYNIFFKRYD